jgi:LmbE family N-acetylglucosaminyl deacetylase
VTQDLPAPARALAIGAHPDDIEFGCGATLAKWADTGCEVHLLVLTDGSKGSWDAGADHGALVERRKAEQQAAASALGARGATFLGAVDGELDERRAHQGAVCEVIRRTRPDVIVAHDPWKRYRIHPDHRHAGFLTIDAAVAARDPHFFPEQGLRPHRPAQMLLFEADVIDHAETVDRHVERKIAALLCHASQWRSTLDIDPDSDARDEQRQAFEHRIRGEARDTAQSLGIEVLAEAFKRIDGL